LAGLELSGKIRDEVRPREASESQAHQTSGFTFWFLQIIVKYVSLF
jgi:hypothetical protein